ncbi:TetR family transcriptional regulator [Saccharopolyspora kobensis]|nr:TetR family transcriptional regulator [Saccharopolyspora kobensis]
MTTETGSRRIVRSDAERNRRRLIKSAAFLVNRRGTTVKMTDVAERAEVATARAYRHFSSIDEILAEFGCNVGLRLLKFQPEAREPRRGAALRGER